MARGQEHAQGDGKKQGVETERPPLTVVGIGASAGGLTALKVLLPSIPPHTGLAWVVVIHLSPEHKSHLAELLQPNLALPILQVTQTVELEPDCVYVIPPNANLNAIDTHLRLSELDEPPGKRTTVDHFFRTLSRTHDGHAVGVVLTGTGSDGALGIKDIKEKGGLAIVQDPDEAEYDGMPRAALATGLVDLVLPLAEIPAAVLRYAQTEPRVSVRDEGVPKSDEDRLLQKVFAHLRARTGRDVSQYKRSTILRRIVRRMQMKEIEELHEYLALLGEDGEETRALADDLLITVTSFFRDGEVWDALQKSVIPRLFQEKGPRDEIRAWSAGCATGEEAYSLAMLLLEAAERQDAPPRVQIFASDLHERSLRRAREGFYPGDIEVDVSASRLKRFFKKENGGYRVLSELRDAVVFSPHNLLGDPPFSRLDVVLCRNVMIYLQTDVQQYLLELFHYALNPDGILVLGTSERPGDDLVRPEDKEHGIYRRRNVPSPEPRLPVFPMMRRQLAGLAGTGRQRSESSSYGRLHERLVERIAPPSLLLNPEDRVVHLSEHAGRYLVHPGGELTTSAVKLVQPELRLELQSALHQVRDGGEPVRTRPVVIILDGQPRNVVLDVRPSPDADDAGFILVLFEEGPAGVRARASASRRATDSGPTAPAEEGGAVGEVEAPDEDVRISALEAELQAARTRLQAVIERYEVNREEMKAANEELQSANEELRSTMEELETSKEELQSINEELQTVNQENRHKVGELGQLSSDLQNLLTSTDIATLFLDRQLRILRFTPSVEQLFHVRPVDRGRPISDLRHRLGYDELVEDAQRVLERLVPVEREVRDEEGRWYLTKVLPYRGADDRIEGVVMTFVDITGQKDAEEELRRAKTYAESIVETLHVPLLVLSPDLRVRSANAAFHEHFHVRPEETTGRMVYDLGNGQWNIPQLKTLLEEILPENRILSDYEVRHVFEELGERVMLLDARRLDHVQLVLLGIRDITDRKRAEEALGRAKAEAEHANQVKGQFLSTMSHELRTPLTAVLGFTDLLQTGVVGPVNAKQKEHLGRINKSAWHLVRLIDDILAFSRTEAGKLRVSLEQVDLADAVRDVARMLESTAAESHRELTVTGVDGAVPATTDPARVTQILTNLIGNALKYSEAGPIEIELAEDDGRAEIRVRDHGPGIPADQQEAVFDPFVQLDGSATRKHGGTGLGLTIARRLARMLGGDLTLESELGNGSTFILRLPLEAPVTAGATVERPIGWTD